MNARVAKILQYNEVFVDNELYLKYTTSKYPDRKIAILSCMDTRMTQLLPAALGLKNGDVKMITNAGALLTHPCGSGIYSLLVAIYELDVDTIMVVGHDDCGGKALNGVEIVEKMRARGVTQDALDHAAEHFMPVEEWMTGFGDVEHSVQHTVEIIANHGLIPKEIEVFGFVMDPETGLLRAVKND
ncbi:carbonic anhydrase [Chakrabartyella piscis]|uniref:beta-class carbonic anhydrase n=1 Tax=Chakrabartyella piscis TaxID=2918914 RepID=UPI002958DDA8|nr:carbonic anhydrase [Chakrabartyella piscis]